MCYRRHFRPCHGPNRIYDISRAISDLRQGCASARHGDPKRLADILRTNMQNSSGCATVASIDSRQLCREVAGSIDPVGEYLNRRRDAAVVARLVTRTNRKACGR